MIDAFGRSTLERLVEQVTFPEPLVNDAAVLKAVQLWINGEKDEASEVLRVLIGTVAHETRWNSV
ncbi:hypothetical protein BGX26_008536 [Mortierella sp. AD094]|nr:hypothetical protein BGX26_008536 [Mortierella sp. AD094]